jgi:hypothetical protein
MATDVSQDVGGSEQTFELASTLRQCTLGTTPVEVRRSLKLSALQRDESSTFLTLSRASVLQPRSLYTITKCLSRSLERPSGCG